MLTSKQEDNLENEPKTILFAAEGTYPYIMGGVSSWSDQLIHGLDDFYFKVMTVVGTHPVEPTIAIPENVQELIPIHFWRPRKGVSQIKSKEKRLFYEVIYKFLTCPQQDFRLFAKSLLALAKLGHRYNLWPLFEDSLMWGMVRYSLTKLTREAGLTKEEFPGLGEVNLALNWLRATLVPLLFVPPKADLVHVVTNGLCVIPAFIAARVHKVPLLLTEHGIYLRERYLDFQQEEDPYSLKLLRARFYKFLAQLTYLYSNRVTSVSNFNRYWQLELGAPEERVEVIPNGIDPKSFPISEFIYQDKPTIVWIGRIDPLKDLETLLNAFAVVKEKMPSAQLRLFGPVPQSNEEYHQHLESIIQEKNLAPNARFEGPISPAYKAYHAADVVVLSSISEGFPYTVVEAMMCGKPVVSTRAGGVGDAIDESVGRLVPLRSSIPLAKALLEILENRNLCVALGIQANQKALKEFTLEKMCYRYRNLYLSTLEEPIIRLTKRKHMESNTFAKESDYLRQLPLDIFFKLDEVLNSTNQNKSPRRQEKSDHYLKQLPLSIFFELDNVLNPTNQSTLRWQKDENTITLKKNFLTEDEGVAKSLANIKEISLAGDSSKNFYEQKRS